MDRRQSPWRVEKAADLQFALAHEAAAVIPGAGKPDGVAEDQAAL
jgi:hypothetical protein